MTLDVLALGAAAGGLAVLVRALPWPEAWKTRKPLSCPTCFGAHSATVTVVAAWGLGVLPCASWQEIPMTWLALTGISAWINSQVIPSPIDFSATALLDENLAGSQLSDSTDLSNSVRNV